MPAKPFVHVPASRKPSGVFPSAVVAGQEATIISGLLHAIRPEKLLASRHPPADAPSLRDLKSAVEAAGGTLDDLVPSMSTSPT